ncbi:hypothetical protein NKH80_28480 [Mesorhizobium sp. M0904]|uniref:hypothetical protein n=1 Tax=Mesorhizobium sp. M0904 TaxID=2957022 RepID=UPI00333B3CBC
MADLNQRIVDTLARAFEDRSADRFPTLAVSCRKCRVGSTALTNLFGIAGFRPPAGQDCHALEALGQPGAPWIVRRSPDMSNANACLMVSSILSEPVLARQSGRRTTELLTIGR